ncbi:MAG TPA: anti-sigma factor [Pyrinomonadaceae bacterium]
MNCQEAQHLMHGYMDGELDLLSNLHIEEHIGSCHPCALAYQNQQALKDAMSDGSLYFNAPANLQRRVRSLVREADKKRRGQSAWSWRWLAAGASLALFAIIIGVLVLGQSGANNDELLAQEVISSHVRSLMANHLTDVPSSDQHTVKPWFDGKLDYSPTVTDLGAQGFSLVGGRLDYLGNRAVAALVYQRRQHYINLFIWPAMGDASGQNKMAVRQGYNLIHWNRAGMTYWAVSDLNISELQEFAQDLQNQK